MMTNAGASGEEEKYSRWGIDRERNAGSGRIVGNPETETL
jgi:hypothetical protein